MGKEAALLRYVADAAVLRGDALVALSLNDGVAERDDPAVGLLKPSDYSQEGGLATARGPKDRGEGPFWHGQIHADEYGVGAEGLVQIADGESGHRRVP